MNVAYYCNHPLSSFYSFLAHIFSFNAILRLTRYQNILRKGCRNFPKKRKSQTRKKSRTNRRIARNCACYTLQKFQSTATKKWQKILSAHQGGSLKWAQNDPAVAHPKRRKMRPFCCRSSTSAPRPPATAPLSPPGGETSPRRATAPPSTAAPTPLFSRQKPSFPLQDAGGCDKRATHPRNSSFMNW